VQIWRAGTGWSKFGVNFVFDGAFVLFCFAAIFFH